MVKLVLRAAPRATLASVALVASAGVANPALADGPGNAAAGQALYQAKCGGCHSLDANRIGPAHRGVVGRKVATAPGYAYSLALRKLGGVWTPARLDRWLQGPQALAPGSKMYLVVGDAAQRRDIIAYLQSTATKKRTGHDRHR